MILLDIVIVGNGYWYMLVFILKCVDVGIYGKNSAKLDTLYVCVMQLSNNSFHLWLQLLPNAFSLFSKQAIKSVLKYENIKSTSFIL